MFANIIQLLAVSTRTLWNKLCNYSPVQSPPDEDRPFLRPTQDVILRPVGHPTPEQIRFVQSRFPHLGNLLHVRKHILKGGLGFGSQVPERLRGICEELRLVDLPFGIEPSRLWFDTRYNCTIGYVHPDFTDKSSSTSMTTAPCGSRLSAPPSSKGRRPKAV